jgi:putative membrane protein
MESPTASDLVVPATPAKPPEPGHSQAPLAATKSPEVADPRVYLAAERTFLAWVRTVLALIGFGFLIVRFELFSREAAFAGGHSASNRWSIASWLGFSMVCFGVMLCLVSALRYRAYVRELESGIANPPVRHGIMLILAVAIVLAGLAMAFHLLLMFP